MKTVETTFTPSEKSDNGVAEGTIAITGTDKEVQSMLKKVNEVKDTTISDMFVVGEFVRVSDETLPEFSLILSVNTGILGVADAHGKSVDVDMSSVQNMGYRRVLVLIGDRVPRDIEVGDMVILTDDMLYECITVGTTTNTVALVARGNRHVLEMCKFSGGDVVVTLHGGKGIVQWYETDGMITVAVFGNVLSCYESELEPWNEVTAIQRYAASFGMKVAVDVS